MNWKCSLAILLLWSIPYNFFGQDIALSFHHLNRASGLSNNTNSYVYKDSRGYVWLSSLDGLNRFDGQNIKVYRPNLEDKNSIHGNIISSNFFEDDKGNLWFTTYGSINCYLRAFDHFVSFQLQNESGVELTEDYRAFHLDEEDGLWIRTGLRDSGLLHRFDTNDQVDKIIGTIDGQRNYYLKSERNTAYVISTMFGEESGLTIHQVEKNDVVHAQKHFIGNNGLPPLFLYNIYADDLEDIYLGSEDGLVNFSAFTGQFKIHDSFQGETLGRVWSVTRLHESELLVSSEYLGLLRFDEKIDDFVQRYASDRDRAYSITSNNIKEIYVDRSSCIWVSIWGEGVDYACLDKNRFELQTLPTSSNRSSDISAMVLDSEDNIWISDRNLGIIKLDSERNISETWDPISALKMNRSHTLENLYLGTGDGLWGVVRNNENRSSSLIFKENQSNFWNRVVTDLSDITALHDLDDGRKLVTTRMGVYELDENLTLRPLAELQDYNTLPFYRIYQDELDHIYLSASYDRVVICELRDGGEIKVLNEVQKIGNVHSFYESGQDSIVWMASTSGLLKLNKYTFDHTLLGPHNGGIPTESMFALKGSEDGTLWIKNQSGIIHYNTNRLDYRDYNEVDGAQVITNNQVAHVQDSSGTIWFAGPRGITHFNPKDIHPYPIAASPQISDIKINNKAIALDTFIGERKSLRLQYDENTINLNFVPNTFSDPIRTQFRYRVLGYDPEWVIGESQGVARLVNVPWGDYTFEVQASNSDGIWSPSKSLNICIEPPWWVTWWAFALYTIAAYLVVRGYYKYRSRLLIEQNTRLEQTVKARTAELSQSLRKLQETQAELIHAEKMASLGQVTSGVAHEIQNPLNFVNNFSDVSGDLLQEMMEEIEKGDVEEAKVIAKDVIKNMSRISHHGNRADRIVRNMMEHSRVNTGEATLTDINALVRANLRRTYNLIKNKERYFETIIETNLDDKLSRIKVTSNDIGKVIYNILNNALYATFEKKKSADAAYIPKVQVRTSSADDQVLILIADNGIGMSSEIVEKIFQPFYSLKPSGEGTGLGLSMSYDIVKAHRGKIIVESEINEGSTFTIQLPKRE